MVVVVPTNTARDPCQRLDQYHQKGGTRQGTPPLLAHAYGHWYQLSGRFQILPKRNNNERREAHLEDLDRQTDDLRFQIERVDRRVEGLSEGIDEIRLAIRTMMHGKQMKCDTIGQGGRGGFHGGRGGRGPFVAPRTCSPCSTHGVDDSKETLSAFDGSNKKTTMASNVRNTRTTMVGTYPADNVAQHMAATIAGMESILDFKEVPDDRRVGFIATGLRGRAEAWFMQLKWMRHRMGKPKITSWAKFLDEYTKEFYWLLTRIDIRETTAQLVSRYISSLRVSIQDMLNMFISDSVSDAHQRAVMVEQQQARRSSNFLPGSRGGPDTPPTAIGRSFGPGPSAGSSHAGQGTNRATTSGLGSGPRCFGCGDFDHRQAACPRGSGSRVLFAEETEAFSAAKFIIDSGSYENVVAQEAADKLHLSTVPHPQPYTLAWIQRDNAITVDRRVLVSFSIGPKYRDQVWCDVVPMDACHLLLGRPWQFDRAATHDGRLNTYSFLFGGIKIVLHPGPPRPWPGPSSSSVLFLSRGAIEDDTFCLSIEKYPNNRMLGLREIVNGSGTIGDPKGIMISNNNIVTIIVSIIAGVICLLKNVDDSLTVNDVYLSYSTLAHIFDCNIAKYFINHGAAIGFWRGDIGEWPPDGSLMIVDRKKKYFKLSQGHYVAVENLENVDGLVLNIDSIWVYGNNFKDFPVAIINPNKYTVEHWAEENVVHFDPVSFDNSDGDETGSDSRSNPFQPGEDDGDETPMTFLDKYDRLRI
ncbi:long chain acyl-CoA synthetase 4 [Striga asiatica]|uniref:Long chain acyl-CoA synthetase 4 n=1 Tax=Striga asiatica TaxID=4170 RepID=A0A5A7R4W6_STRAF|nr:long chain acyl-CoA synthetase 4 [Striga asiatica]